MVTVSTQKGCCKKCKFCDCHKLSFKGNLSLSELVHEVTGGVALSNIDKGQRLNVHFARMGEPTYNFDVIECARICGEIYKNQFKEYHPVVSTMLPKRNKRLKEFLFKWCELQENNWNGGIGLQFSINTLNENDRNEMFNGMSLSLQEISDLIKELPKPKERKYTLNFAVTSKCDLNVETMNRYFDTRN